MMDEKDIKKLYEELKVETPTWHEGVELLERVLQINIPPVCISPIEGSEGKTCGDCQDFEGGAFCMA